MNKWINRAACMCALNLSGMMSACNENPKKAEGPDEVTLADPVLDAYREQIGLAQHPRRGYVDAPGDVLLPSQIKGDDPLYKREYAFKDSQMITDSVNTERTDKTFEFGDQTSVGLFATYMGVVGMASLEEVTSCTVSIRGLDAPRVRMKELREVSFSDDFAAARKRGTNILDKSLVIVLRETAHAASISVACKSKNAQSADVLAAQLLSQITWQSVSVTSGQQTVQNRTIGSAPVIRFGGPGTPFTDSDAARLQHKVLLILPGSDARLEDSGGPTLLMRTSWKDVDSDLAAIKKGAAELKIELEALRVKQAGRIESILAALRKATTAAAKKPLEVQKAELDASVKSLRERVAALP